MLGVATDGDARSELAATLDELCREGARRMLAAALEAEVDAYVAVAGEVDERGHRPVVRNGHHRPRAITTVAGAIQIRAPRVNGKRVDPSGTQRMRFRSSIVPLWCRKSPKVTEVLPLLYLHGLSTGDFAPALVRARAGGVLRLGRRAERVGGHSAHPPVARRASGVHVQVVA